MTDNRHLEGQLFIFGDCRLHCRRLVGPTLGIFCDFFMIVGAKVGDSFQVHVFGDPRHGNDARMQWLYVL